MIRSDTKFLSFMFLALVAPVWTFYTDAANANELPNTLANAKAQFYTFLEEIASSNQKIVGNQRLVLNSTIIPLDLATDTPFYNQQLFRTNSDRTFKGGTESVIPTPPLASATRFSSQYRSLIDMAAAKIDQSHPEIRNSIEELLQKLKTATTQLNDKNQSFEEQWEKIVVSRKLKLGPDYELQRVAWLAQVRYADQIEHYSGEIDRVNSQIDSVRRGVYSAEEIALLENVKALGKAYNVARPWQANTERSFSASGTPLTEVMLADPTKLPPSMFDSSPLILPNGDLAAFLTGKGERTFDTSSQSSRVDEGTKTWYSRGGASYFGWSLGGGGSGSSSFKHSISKMSALQITFENLSEYFADRSAWFNPAVLEDPKIMKLVKDRREIDNLQYVPISLIIARGTTLVLKFGEKVNKSDWSQQSFGASGGVSFFGFGIGGGGGNASSNSTITVDENGTTVTIRDSPSVTRVLGVRVEPFLQSRKGDSDTATNLSTKSETFKKAMDAFNTGSSSYLELQKAKINALKELQ